MVDGPAPSSSTSVTTRIACVPAIAGVRLPVIRSLRLRRFSRIEQCDLSLLILPDKVAKVLADGTISAVVNPEANKFHQWLGH